MSLSCPSQCDMIKILKFIYAYQIKEHYAGGAEWYQNIVFHEPLPTAWEGATHVVPAECPFKGFIIVWLWNSGNMMLSYILTNSKCFHLGKPLRRVTYVQCIKLIPLISLVFCCPEIMHYNHRTSHFKCIKL